MSDVPLQRDVQALALASARTSWSPRMRTRRSVAVLGCRSRCLDVRHATVVGGVEARKTWAEGDLAIGREGRDFPRPPRTPLPLIRDGPPSASHGSPDGRPFNSTYDPLDVRLGTTLGPSE